MKSKIAILLAMATLSQLAQAEQPTAIVLTDGSTAVVFATSGGTITYVKSADVGVDGKVVLTPAEVFDGTRLAKLGDGRCVKIVDRLVNMEDVVAGGLKIQVPMTQHSEETVTCGS